MTDKCWKRFECQQQNHGVGDLALGGTEKEQARANQGPRESPVANDIDVSKLGLADFRINEWLHLSGSGPWTG